MTNEDVTLVLVVVVLGIVLAAGADGGEGVAEGEGYAVWDRDVAYRSSEHPELTLYAEFVKLDEAPKPVLLYLQGWQGPGTIMIRDLGENRFMQERFFLFGADKRGHGRSEGKADVSGWELQDLVDAVEYAKAHYAEYIDEETGPYVMGHSGGCGNTMALMGKFPDFFAAAYGASGMSDYGEWYRMVSWWATRAGKISLNTVMGGSPDEKPEAYRSRGGIVTVENLLTPLFMKHGELDQSVPPKLTEMYVEKARSLGKTVKYEIVKGVKHGCWGNYEEMVAFLLSHKTPPEIPPSGEMVVAGYLKTRKFELIHSTIDTVGRVKYALGKSAWFEIEGGRPGRVRVRVPGKPAKISVAGGEAGEEKAFETARRGEWVEISFEHDTRTRVDVAR